MIILHFNDGQPQPWRPLQVTPHWVAATEHREYEAEGRSNLEAVMSLADILYKELLG